MANYMSVSRTNYFRVTDEEKYQVLFSNLCSESDIEDFTEERDGVLYHGFGTYGSVEYLDEDENYNFDLFLNELQKILPDNEAFMYFESGYEKLRYVIGYAVVVTSKEIAYENIGDWAISKAKELLGSDFKTKIDY